MVRQLTKELSDGLHVINGTPKRATLYALDNDTLSGTGIEERLMELTSGRATLPSRPAFRGYCDDTLVPLEFAISESGETNTGGDASYFTLTERGKKFGVPLAIFGNNWEAENGIPLAQVLGASSSPKSSKSPDNRTRILMFLEENPGSNLKKVSDFTGVDKSLISRHYRALENNGIISSKSQKSEKNIYLTERGISFLRDLIYPIFDATLSEQALTDFYQRAMDIQARTDYRQSLINALNTHFSRQTPRGRSSSTRAK